jgi:thymidylate kinase
MNIQPLPGKLAIQREISESPEAPASHPVSVHASLLSQVFAELDTQEISFCLLRNFEDLPDVVDGDVDFLVRAADLPRLKSILLRLFEGCLLYRKLEKNEHLIFDVSLLSEAEQAVKEKRPAQVLRLDFVTNIQWKGMAYLGTDAVLSARQRYGDFYVLAPAHQAVHLLYHVLLDKNYVKSAYRERILQLISQDAEAVGDALTPLITGRVWQRLYRALAEGDDEAVLGFRNQLISRLAFRRPQSLPEAVVFLINKTRRLVRVILVPPGVVIATAGPDGAGKSTLLHNVGAVLGEAFHPVKDQYMGWKEFILPTKRLLLFILKTVESRPRSEGNGPATARPDPASSVAVASDLSILHYFLDLWVRHILKIRPVKVRDGLVLCDRYFYDILVRDAWICRNRWSRWLLTRLMPKPTIAILFVGDASAIADRKRELSTAEVRQQIEDFSVVATSNTHVVKLDALSPLEENVMGCVMALFGPSMRRI